MNQCQMMGRRLLMLEQQGDIPAGYEEVKYIQSSGTQWINTHIVPFSGIGIEMQYQYNTDVTSNGTIVFGAINKKAYWFSGDWKNEGLCVVDALYGYWGGCLLYNQTNSQITTDQVGYRNRYYISLFPGSLVIRGRQYTDPLKENECICQKEIYLFTYNTGSTVGTTGKFRCFFFSIYDSSNTPVLLLKPVIRKIDSKPGMFDIVSKAFLTNQGTGEFGYEMMDGTYVAPV